MNSKEATDFRIWATNTLKEYIKKGFVLNDEMLKNIASSLLNANKDNHKKLSGTIETLHDGSVWHVGTVIKSENKEYYIEQIDTSWSYGQAHTRRFYVTRGGSKVNTAS